MKVPLRVLTAIRDHVPPVTADLEALRSIVPECSDVPPDLLAFEVIQQAVKARAKGRGVGS